MLTCRSQTMHRTSHRGPNASPEHQQAECHSHVLAGAPAQGDALRLAQTGSLAPSLPHPELGRRLYERTPPTRQRTCDVERHL